MDQNLAAPLTDEELDDINWRATRGCHFEGNFLPGSKYAEEVIEQDVPRLVIEVRRLRGLLDNGVMEIAVERQQQMAKGFSAKHDDQHVHGELAAAGAAYAFPSRCADLWPFEMDAFPREDYSFGCKDSFIKAAALFAAEIARLQRIEAAHQACDAHPAES